MRFFTAVLAAIALAVPALATPATMHTVHKYNGQTTGRYIVSLKNGVTKASVLGEAKAKSTYADLEIINGFASTLDAETLDALRANPDVEYIEEDGIMHTMANVTQTNAPWGLARISSRTRLVNQDASALTFSYTFGDAAGDTADIYVIDTGVLTTHSQFGGRARFGATFGGYRPVDGNGHGTHCAGTAAGSQFGVAKKASIIAVKVLSDAGSGSVADIVSGMNFVLISARSTGRPSIASMSLGGGASIAMDSAVGALTNGGVHVAAAAGNANVDAGNTSPARAPTAVTVAASTIADAKASFSNYGSVVKVWAPGQDIISSWIGSSNNEIRSISGTSMATPHVAGLIAYLISTSENISPAAMSTKIQSLSLRGVLSGVPASTLNLLAQNA